MKGSIAAIILTKNEQQHISRCINSIKDVCEEVFVVDSYSTDDTEKIAQQLGAHVYSNPWTNYATQFLWAINNCDIHSDWIWRIDADEYVTPEDANLIHDAVRNCEDNVNGITVNRKIVFMGHPIKHGGWYPVRHLKLIRKGFGTIENTFMDEHLVIFSGKTIHVETDQIDFNLNNISWWTDKHNGYSDREALNMLSLKYDIFNDKALVNPKINGNTPERKRWFKLKYAKAPLFLRPFVYFIYRYFFKLGILDGKSGFIWNVLQGFWYRFLVDVKIYEIMSKCGFNENQVKQYVSSEIENIRNKTNTNENSKNIKP